jgi:hypothetical protein
MAPRVLGCLYRVRPRLLLAGGDVKSLVIALQRNDRIAAARGYFNTEYSVGYLIHV